MDHKTDKKLYLVFSNPVEGKEREFNEWYDNVHVRDVLSIPGMLTAQRFSLCEAEMAHSGAMAAPAHRYLLVYEMEGDVDAVMTKVQEAVASGAMEISDTLDLGNVAMSFWSPRGPVISA